jgi:hypothetical protein
MIVKYTSEPPPNFDGVILIDCWQPQENEIDKLIFFYKLADYIGYNKDQYHQIINASMQCRINPDDQTIVNTMQSYSWNHKFSQNTSPTVNHHNTSVLLNAIEQFSGSYRLFQGLQTQLKSQNNCHYIVSFADFLMHWSRGGHNRPKNWLVVGQSWQNCVHNNDIGLQSFSEILDYYKMNFYVREEFVLNEDDQNPTETDFSNDTLNWMKYHGTSTYKLMPKHINILS